MHINFVNDDKILIIIEKKRFVVIITNDFINYIFIYLLSVKLNFLKIFNNYLNFINVKEILVQRICLNNKEKYVKHKIIKLIKEYKIK